MQSASSRIWNRFAVSISSDDNHYIMGTSSEKDSSYYSMGDTVDIFLAPITASASNFYDLWSLNTVKNVLQWHCVNIQNY